MTEQIKHCDRKELKGKCSLYANANLQDCIDCNRALQKPITEQIKSAIEELESRISPYNCCQADYLANEAIKIAIRSLKAWEEVIEKLEERETEYSNNEFKPLTDNMYWRTRNLGIRDAINIIDEHLVDIEE